MNVVHGLPVSQLDPITQQLFSGASKVFEPFLGPMPQLARVDQYENRNSDIYSLPEAYKGQNKYLGETVTDLTITAHLSYLLRYILPPQVTDQLTQTWTKLVNNAHMMDITPYLSRSHKVTKQKKFLKTTLYRIGIEAEFEVEFMGTPEGRVDFMATLRQFVNAAKETMHQAAFRALTQCHRNQNNFLQQTSHLAFSEFKKYLDQDREWFACVQKKRFALGKLDTVISKEMEQRQGEADAYLIPEEIAIHAMWRPEMTDYYVAGELGPARVNALPGPNRGTSAGDTQGTLERVEPLHMIKQFPAYLVKSRVPQNVTEEEVMNLARVRQIGEYYTMLENCDYQGEYKSKHRHILKFDEDENDMVEIPLMAALDNCGIFDKDSGDVKPVTHKAKDTAAMRQDLDKDFLMTKVGTRGDKVGQSSGYGAVKMIGDIDPAFLPTHFLICAGKSLKSSMFSSWTNITSNKNVKGVSVTTTQATLDILGRWVGVGSAVFNEIYQNITDETAVTYDSTVDSTRLESNVDKNFLLGCIVAAPAGKREEVEALVADDSRPLFERTEKVRDKIIEYANANVSGLKSQVKTPEKVNEWYNNLKKEYQVLKSQESIGSQVQGGSSKQEVVGFVPKGTDLKGTGLKPVGRLVSEVNRDPSLAIIDRHMKGIMNTAEDALIKFLAGVYLLIRMNKNVLKALVAKDIRIPMNFLFLQPHMQYLTRAIIKCKQNGGTGVMLTGHDNFMMSWESGRKSGQMHYTTHIRPFIYNPENVYVKADVYVQGYEGGAGSRFYDVDSYRRKDHGELVNSLICVAIPLVETKFPLPLDITGRFHTQYTMQQMDGQGQFERQLHYSTAPRYVQMYGFGKDGKQGSDVPPMMPGRHHDNTVCYPGHHQLYDPNKNGFTNVKVGKGHWGKDVYPGCASIRHGSLDVLETQNYAVGLTN